MNDRKEILFRVIITIVICVILGLTIAGTYTEKLTSIEKVQALIEETQAKQAEIHDMYQLIKEKEGELRVQIHQEVQALSDDAVVSGLNDMLTEFRRVEDIPKRVSTP